MTLLLLAENSIQLVPDGTIFLHIAIILMMVFVLNATLFKPINKILEEREKRTRGRSSEANDILQRVDEGLSTYERTLRDARTEGYRLMEQERAAAISERQKMLSAVREEVGRSLDEQKKSLGDQANEARTTLAADSRSLAAEIGAQILHRQLSEATISGVN
jgi:F-type H+-transporting ATPase subunit b